MQVGETEGDPNRGSGFQISQENISRSLDVKYSIEGGRNSHLPV